MSGRNTALAELAAEIWLASRLRQYGAAIFDGLTTREQRRDRARQCLLEHNLADVSAGRRDGRQETYGRLFARIYGEALIRTEILAA